MDPADAADDLVNVARFVPKTERYTSFWDKNDNGAVDPTDGFTSIDHILVDQRVAALVDAVVVPHDHDPTKVSDHFPVVVHLRLSGSGPAPLPGNVMISKLLPNPPGSDDQNEAATVLNNSNADVNLAGWKLRDLAGRTWLLDELGTLPAGQDKTILRKGQPMAMNNGGDTIDLVDPMGDVVHSITYGHVDEGEEIIPTR